MALPQVLPRLSRTPGPAAEPRAKPPAVAKRKAKNVSSRAKAMTAARAAITHRKSNSLIQGVWAGGLKKIHFFWGHWGPGGKKSNFFGSPLSG